MEAVESSEAKAKEAHNRPDFAKGPEVQFARFREGQLELFRSHTNELEYIAVSHVFNKTQWLDVAGVKGKVLASTWKARFIEQQLPALVGDLPFWMDILTVNQKDEAEVISVVQVIPSIFHDAVRTLAIREEDGLYPCCLERLASCNDWESIQASVTEHTGGHWHDLRVESYLQRLWTLQECMLSKTIQFAVCSRLSTERAADETNVAAVVYKPQTEYQRLLDSLWVLSYGFDQGHTRGTLGVDEFTRAYVQNGVVTRPSAPRRSSSDDIYTGSFRAANMASHRSASKSRDYIFATMPQFPWYNYPKHAKDMSFGAIFLDLHKQACHSGHSFAPKISASMIDCSLLTPEESWFPSTHQPEPECLGDFLKLLGERLDEDPASSLPHVTTIVEVMELGHIAEKNFDAYLNLIEASMLFCQDHWRESHLGGELSKYGSFPDENWSINSDDARCSGWRPIPGEGGGLLCVEDGDEMHLILQDKEIYEEDESSIDEMMTDLHICSDKDYVPLHQQARIILDHMWCAVDPRKTNANQAGDFYAFKKAMRYQWSRPLLYTMMIFAAMVSCHIGLSALTYIRRFFVPALIRYGNDTRLVGLLSRHARPSQRWKMVRMISAGRHLTGPSLGKDLVLVNPRVSAAPVGIVPDFLERKYDGYDRAIHEEKSRRTRILYHGAVQVNERGDHLVKAIPLDNAVSKLADRFRRLDEASG